MITTLDIITEEVTLDIIEGDAVIDIVSEETVLDILDGGCVTIDIVSEEILLETAPECATVDIVEVESFVLEFDGVLQGPQGESGPAGGSIVVYPAGENLSAGRVVIIDGGEAFYFQPSDFSHSGRAFGITATSATAGNNVNIYAIGEATDAAFSSFADVPLYVGNDGELQMNWPTSGLLQKAGFGTGTNKVKIDFSIQIKQTA